jgi:hypothetical protein
MSPFLAYVRQPFPRPRVGRVALARQPIEVENLQEDIIGEPADSSWACYNTSQWSVDDVRLKDLPRLRSSHETFLGDSLVSERSGGGGG